MTASIPILELEIIFMTLNQGFSIKIPSHLYYDKTEGLCGSCNGDNTDDMATPDGNIPINADEFVKSWKSNGTGNNVYLFNIYQSQYFSMFNFLFRI